MMAIRKYLDLNDNKNTVQQNFQDATKAIFRWKLKALNVYIRKEEWLKINELNMQLKILNNERINLKKEKIGHSKYRNYRKQNITKQKTKI